MGVGRGSVLSVSGRVHDTGRWTGVKIRLVVEHDCRCLLCMAHSFPLVLVGPVILAFFPDYAWHISVWYWWDCEWPWRFFSKTNMWSPYQNMRGYQILVTTNHEKKVCWKRVMMNTTVKFVCVWQRWLMGEEYCQKQKDRTEHKEWFLFRGTNGDLPKKTVTVC